MKALTRKVKEELSGRIVDIATCNLHKVDNAFHKAFENFGIETEMLGINLIYFFKYSPAKREDYEEVQEEAAVKNHIFIRHVSSRGCYK